MMTSLYPRPSSSPAAMALPSPPPPPPTPHNLSRLLNRQSLRRSLRHLKQTHGQIIKHHLAGDSYVAGTLINLYVASAADPQLLTALKVFDQVPNPHVYLWNSLIRAFVDNHKALEAIATYRRMITQCSIPNKYTFPLLLKACSVAESLAEGTQLHAHLAKRGLGRDRHITSAAIQMYAAGGFLPEARRMLGDGNGLDPVCWNAMIDGYMKNRQPGKAKELFEEMPIRNVGSWNAMISGYARSGMIEDSKKLFEEMPEKNEVSWSAMVDAYVGRGCFVDALAMFRRMLSEGVEPKRFLLSTVLAACANVGALEQGRWIHARVERDNIQVDAVLGTSLIDMYAKCGMLDSASEVFERTTHKEVSVWNALIGGLAMHGHSRSAIELFIRMRREGFEPNEITFMGLLSACAHAGEVEEGLKHFNSMERDYGVRPIVEHYGCMVDLLSRAGRFDEAEGLIGSMPMKPNSAVWGALLGGCRIHGNVELGERVGNTLLELDPENSGRYALLSNIYARAGRRDDATKVRKLMKDRGIKTIPGRSLIELDGVVHEFKVGDGSHPSSKEIDSMLKEIMERLRIEGYVPNTGEVLFDINEEEKESALCYHSEKLAIAFGLIRTSPGTTIRIVKNLRVCEDCHSMTKLISRVYRREIIVRDRVRYHRFRDGVCSCMEFW